MKKKIFAVIIAVAIVLVAIDPTAWAADVNAPVIITNIQELKAAINAQKDGQIFIIKPGNYALKRNITYQGKNWFFPIYKNNITIIGEGYPLLYGDQYADNSEVSSQNLITIVGNNVTLAGLIVMPKLSVYKAIEVVGKNAVLRNITTHPNSKTAKFGDLSQEYIDFYTNDFGGSIFFNGDIGNASLQNVSINKAWLSLKDVISGSVSLNNVAIDFRGCGYAPYASYGVMGGAEFLGSVKGLTIRVDNTISSLQTQVIDRVPAKTVIELDASQYYQSVELNKELTLRGANGSAFVTSGTNSAVEVTADDVTIENIEFLKTDNKDQSIIHVSANNFTALDNSFSGQYQANSNAGITSAFEFEAGVLGMNILGNAVNNLRYPAYIHTGATGMLGGNYADNTGGFVAEQGAFVLFESNAFGTNSMDISIVRGPKTDPLSPFYDDTQLLSRDNNDCSVQNKVTKKATKGKPKVSPTPQIPAASPTESITVTVSSGDGFEQIPETGEDRSTIVKGLTPLFIVLLVFAFLGSEMMLSANRDNKKKKK